MKPEPLKNKMDNITHGGLCYNSDVFYRGDVKSAVEWLKQELHIIRHLWSPNTNHIIRKKIDEAFPDLKGN